MAKQSQFGQVSKKELRGMGWHLAHRPISCKRLGNCPTCSKVVPPEVDLAMGTVGQISNCLDAGQIMVTIDWCAVACRKSCLHCN